MPNPKKRIVSLIASATEIVYELGLGSQLVGRSHECDFPPEVVNLPVCTSPKFQTDGSSYEIDQRVKAILEHSLSVYKVHAEILERLHPTHIITQDQCEVCAVSLKDVERAACQLISSRPQIISLKPDSLDDIFQDLAHVGQALDVPERATDVIEKLKARMRKLAHQAKSENSCPKVVCIEWIDPPMAAGNWVPTLIEMAHGKNTFGVAGKHSPWLNWQEMIDCNPDVIIVMPCGFDIPRTTSEMQVLQSKQGWGQLKAVRDKNVFVVDGNQYFNRPGPRIVESLEILIEILYPTLYSKAPGFTYVETGWQRVTDILA